MVSWAVTGARDVPKIVKQDTNMYAFVMSIA